MEKSSVRWWDLSAAALLGAAILVSAWRLTATHWAENLGFAVNMALAGWLVGLALGKSALARWPAVTIAGAYALVLLPLQLSAAAAEDVYLGERLLSLFGRLLASLSEYAAGRPIRDPLFIVALLTTIYWFIGLCTGYFLVRRASVLAVVLPSGIVLFLVHLYDRVSPGRNFLLAMYLLITLLLMARLNYLRSRALWLERRVRLPAEVGMDLNSGALTAALITILVAWVLPATFFYSPTVGRLWEQVARPRGSPFERIGDLFAALEGGPGEGGSLNYSERLSLGTNAMTSPTVAFVVNTPPQAFDLPRFYWRARVYDFYVDGQWSTGEALSRPFSPQDAEFAIPGAGGRPVAEFTFSNHLRGFTTLYTPGQVVWASRPAEALLAETRTGEEDLLALLVSPPLEAGEVYRVRAAIGNPSKAELRAAGQDYPEWVTARYLQLPERLSARIPRLAEEVTAGLEHPYDKAEAITAYLRREIAYSTSIRVPPGVEPLEWVLFDLKQGFCNYYATAEVLMLRSLGIPARLAVGYAQGSAEQQPGEYVVRLKDAHAWPEVYFPGYGWIEFEPTGNQPVLVRLASATASEPVGPGIHDTTREFEERLAPQSGLPAAAPGIAASLIPALAIVAALTVLLALDRRSGWSARLPAYVAKRIERRGLQVPAWLERWANWANFDPVARAFETINLSLRRLGETPTPDSTPAERAARLAALLPAAAPAVHALAAEHEASLYSPVTGDASRARRAALTIYLRTLKTLLLRYWTGQNRNPRHGLET